MSGHSHWATIKRAKGAVDARRGILWSKLSRAIITAVHHGGGDPIMNLKLRYAIDQAREVSMPMDNIERAIKRGTGDAEGHVYDEIVYEGYGPGGIAILVEITTDNRNRTAGEIRKIFDRSGGKIGSSGNVAYLFERKGLLAVPAQGADEDALMNLVLEAGGDDLQRAGDVFALTCDAANFMQVKMALEAQHVKTTLAEIGQVAKVPVDADTVTGQKVLRLIETLEENDDVQHVYSNLHITDAMLA